LCIFPVLVLLIAFNIFPLLASLGISFMDFNPALQSIDQAKYVGTANYAKLLSSGDPEVWYSFQRTAGLVFVTVALQTLIGFGVALLLHRDFFGRGVITALLLIPMMLSPAIMGSFWRYMLHPDWGIINYLLGGRWEWYGKNRLAFWAVVIAEVWMWTPFMMLLTVAGLNSIPPSLYEAAEVDRASAWFRFWNITLPLVAPLVLLGIIFRVMDTFRLFDTAYVLNGNQEGQPTEFVSVLLHLRGFGPGRPLGEATALAYLLLIVAVALANLVVRYLQYIRARQG
jgi:multiple sugar transport system permease protein